MKKYTNLGELLVDYRKRNDMTQPDFAAMMDVDSRTLLRWEKNDTLIKPIKEDELVNNTFIPYQVFRNLNAEVPIPVYYDFNGRKYSLTGLSIKFPEVSWFVEQIQAESPRIRQINGEEDVENIFRFTYSLYKPKNPVDKYLIFQAVKLLPELNLVITDESGYYAGHVVFLPISLQTYQKIRNREMVEGQIQSTDLVNYKTFPNTVFYAYSLAADCNENYFYLMATTLRFFKNFEDNSYLFAVLIIRSVDQVDVMKSMGLDMVWQDKEEQKELGMANPPTLYEGTFTKFLSGL